MRRYVVCFIFTTDLDRVYLCQKDMSRFSARRDAGMVDLTAIAEWNGLGGAIEQGETVYEAAAREVYEEAALTTSRGRWRYIAQVAFANESAVFFMTTRLVPGEKVRATTDVGEPIAWFTDHEVAKLTTSMFVPDMLRLARERLR